MLAFLLLFSEYSIGNLRDRVDGLIVKTTPRGSNMEMSIRESPIPFYSFEQ